MNVITSHPTPPLPPSGNPRPQGHIYIYAAMLNLNSQTYRSAVRSSNGWPLESAKSPVQNGRKHPILHRVSTIQGDAGFRNHPQYGISSSWLDSMKSLLSCALYPISVPAIEATSKPHVFAFCMCWLNPLFNSFEKLMSNMRGGNNKT